MIHKRNNFFINIKAFSHIGIYVYISQTRKIPKNRLYINTKEVLINQKNMILLCLICPNAIIF